MSKNELQEGLQKLKNRSSDAGKQDVNLEYFITLDVDGERVPIANKGECLLKAIAAVIDTVIFFRK